MSSEQSAMIALHPFFRTFAFAVVKSIREKNISPEDRVVIHADMVPKFTEKVVQASMGERVTVRAPVAPPVKILPPRPKRDMSALVAPIELRRPLLRAPPRPVQIVQPAMPQPVRPVQVARPQIAPAIIPFGEELSQDYGKITPLLNDPSVSSIECIGAGKEIFIIRAGQKQITRIILSKQEIEEILEKVSEAVHIPLLEGVFRAAVDNFSVNAVISEMIGSRFIIKKATPYAMLER